MNAPTRSLAATICILVAALALQAFALHRDAQLVRMEAARGLQQ